jgi:hypothetical protein
MDIPLSVLILDDHRPIQGAPAAVKLAADVNKHDVLELESREAIRRRSIPAEVTRCEQFADGFWAAG